MWAVFRYSTGRVFAYFTDESSARTYCDLNNSIDQTLSTEYLAPDWGWMLVPMTDALRELLEA